jgi:hypothetical protein
MKCFYDPTQDAVGSCRSCFRGLSQAHLVDLVKGLACKGRCEQDVARLIAYLEVSQNSMAQTQNSVNRVDHVMRTSARSGYAGALFILAFGLICIVTEWTRPTVPFLFHMGALFIAFGTWRLIQAVAYARAVSTSPSSCPPDGDSQGR